MERGREHGRAMSGFSACAGRDSRECIKPQVGCVRDWAGRGVVPCAHFDEFICYRALQGCGDGVKSASISLNHSLLTVVERRALQSFITIRGLWLQGSASYSYACQFNSVLHSFTAACVETFHMKRRRVSTSLHSLGLNPDLGVMSVPLASPFTHMCTRERETTEE